MPDIKEDWELWKWRMVFLEDCPESEAEELRMAIHEDWITDEGKEYWTKRIHEEAEFSRELRLMAKDVVSNIKAAA